MRGGRLTLLMVLILALFLGDQLSKSLMVDMFRNGEIPAQVTSFFNLVLGWNKGVSFSFLRSDSESMPYILGGFSLLVSFGLLIWLIRERILLIQIGLGFIIAGALGNAFDRFTHSGVIDFLQFHYADWYFPAFNVADICINIGVGLVLIDVLFLSGHRSKTDKKLTK